MGNSRLIDLTGKKFGRWLVIERLSNTDYGKRMWLCVCECSLKKPVDGASLKNGKSKGCRECKSKDQEKSDEERVKPKRITKKKFNKDGTKHGNFIDLTGKTFGRWKVLSLAEEKNNGNNWMCECECGLIRPIITSNLTRLHSKGCQQCYSNSKKIEATQSLWYNIQRGAKERNLEFSITKDEAFELLEKQNRKCALSGIDITIAITRLAHGKGGTTASLDRINSNKGYTIDNIQWVHKDVNQMKMDFDQDYFVNFCYMIVNESERRKSLQENSL